MLKITTFVAISALALAVTLTPKPALADNGAIAAGVVGGLAVGAIVGSQMSRDDGYRERRYRYRSCHTELQEVTDSYGHYRVVPFVSVTNYRSV